MSFYLRKEWIDQADGIQRVAIRYAATHLGQEPDWERQAQWREMHPEAGRNRKRRAKVLKLPRNLEGRENYLLHYTFQIHHPDGSWEWSPAFVDEIVCDDSYTFIDYWGRYTNICVHWSLDGWGAPNYSAMFVQGVSLDHPLSSLHYYGRAHDGVYTYDRYRFLNSLPLPRVYCGRVHGPKSSRVRFCYHIARLGSPDGDYDFWDDNEGLSYWKDLK